MLRRLLFLIIVLYAVWRILVAMGNRQRRTAARAEDFSRFSARRRDRFRHTGEALVPCDHCGVHVPRSRIVEGRRGVYCGASCRDAAENPPEGGAGNGGRGGAARGDHVDAG